MKHSMNPFCEIALEEAVKLKEKGTHKQQKTVLLIVKKNIQELLKKSLSYRLVEKLPMKRYVPL